MLHPKGCLAIVFFKVNNNNLKKNEKLAFGYEFHSGCFYNGE